MIRYLRLALVVITAVVLQTTLFTHLRIDGVVPDVGLVCVLAVAYEDGPDTGAWFGFVMGLSIDLFLTTPLGLSALSFALTGYAVGVFQAGMVRTTPRLAPILGLRRRPLRRARVHHRRRARGAERLPLVREPEDRLHRRGLRRADCTDCLPGGPPRARASPTPTSGGSGDDLAATAIFRPRAFARMRSWTTA